MMENQSNGETLLQAIAAPSMSVKFSDIIEKYNGEGDIVEWVEKLEMVASLQGVTNLCNFLPCFLTSGAFTVYKGFDETIRKDFGKVKQALIDVFSNDRFTVYESLMHRKLKPNESVDVYVADIKRMIALIDKNVSEEFAKSAFVFGLPDNIKQQLKAACSLSEMTLGQILQRTRAILSVSSFKTCCVSKTSDSLRPKPKNFESNYEKNKVFVCYHCGKEGHTRNRCPIRSGKRCFKCGQLGHFIADCLNSSEKVNDFTPKNE